MTNPEPQGLKTTTAQGHKGSQPEDLICPTLHMNGTGYRMLIEGYENARQAVREALEALAKIEFNARDYYVQGDRPWALAVKQMDVRRKKLADVFYELEEIMLNIDEQGSTKGIHKR